MPELPEVQITVDGLNAKVKGLEITDVWTNYDSPFHRGKDNIKDPKYFSFFKKNVVGSKITGAERQGKNILIHLSNQKIILAHMKMTGHFMYGKYHQEKNAWLPTKKDSPLSDSINKNVRLVFTLSNGKHLVFADTRKFAKVYVFEKSEHNGISDLTDLGPDPLSKDFSLAVLKKRLEMRRNWKIKQALLDQKVIAGIGNIYSDEMLWSSSIHPLSIAAKIPKDKMKLLYKAMRDVLKKSLNFGGDSTSDYRNIYGLPGEFQHKHNVYRLAGKPCPKKDGGVIERIKIAGRSGHFCPIHQVLYK